MGAVNVLRMPYAMELTLNVLILILSLPMIFVNQLLKIVPTARLLKAAVSKLVIITLVIMEHFVSMGLISSSIAVFVLTIMN